MPLMTSISVKDSLFENESYFYAELKRLSNIVGELEAGKEIFIVLDEILKGTNSNDKLKGSISLMKKLAKLNGSGIVATHDILLGELETQLPDNIHNQSFEVALENDFLYYDYKLYEGVCKNLNASFLMKKMGIID
jgi:DNA mismatch repair ATPase MutS